MQALPATQQRLQRPLASSLEKQRIKGKPEEKMSFSVPFSVSLRLEAYEICQALRAVSRLSIFLFFMADFYE